MHLSAQELLHYTDEERQRWEQWFHDNGDDLLRMPIGARHKTTVGALIVNIFSSEVRCVQRLRDEPLTGCRGQPCEHIEEVFGFGLETRRLMRDFVRRAVPEDWTRVVAFSSGSRSYRATARRMVLHSLLHEVRHWAQVERIMLDRGFEPPGDHDLLTSSALI